MILFQHQDYRDFIKAYLKTLPKEGHGELRRISQTLNINQTLLSQILSGTRDFNPDQAFALSNYLGLSPLETEYFLILLQIEKAATKTLKDHLVKKRDEIKKESLNLSKRVPHEKTLSDEEKAIFYSSWIYSAVRLFTSIEKGVTTDEVVQKFSITRAKAAEILRFLTSTGLCVEEKGLFTQGVQRTHLDRTSPYIQRHHSNWRVKAIQRSDNLEDDELMFTGPLSISYSDFTKVREKIVDLIKEVSNTVKESDPEEVACFNVDLFWVE